MKQKYLLISAAAYVLAALGMIFGLVGAFIPIFVIIALIFAVWSFKLKEFRFVASVFILFGIVYFIGAVYIIVELIFGGGQFTIG
jgi:hypothetical protein